MSAHLVAFSIGFIINLILGDITGEKLLPKFIKFIGEKLYDGLYSGGVSQEKRKKGLIFIVFMILIAFLSTGALMLILYSISKFLGAIVEIFLTYEILSVRPNPENGMVVITSDSIADHIKFLAKNAYQGIATPLILLALGGPTLGLIYMTVAISLKEYEDEDFSFFTRGIVFVVDFIPSRLAALLMIIVSLFGGDKYSSTGATQVFIRDRYKLKDKNLGQTLSVLAGALGSRVDGCGDGLGSVNYEDVKDVRLLCFFMSIVVFVICFLCILI